VYQWLQFNFSRALWQLFRPFWWLVSLLTSWSMSSTSVCWQAASSIMRKKNGFMQFAHSWLVYGKIFSSGSIKHLHWRPSRHSNFFLDQFQSSALQHFLEPKFTWLQCSGSMLLSSLSKIFLKSKNRWAHSWVKTEYFFSNSTVKFILVFYPPRKNYSTLVTTNNHRNGEHWRRV